MIGRYSKIFLPILTGLALSFFGALLSRDALATGPYGSITVCKVIADNNGNVVDGSSQPGVTFSIAGFTPSPVTSEGAPVGQIGNSQFTTPLTFNADVLSSASGNDAQCVTYSELAIGGYYYTQETISDPSGWASPKYNDQFTTPVTTLADFFDYDGKLFDGDGTNDAARNKNADGHIVLTNARPDRTLIVLNRQTPALPTGGGGGGVGGGQAPSCPVDGLPQKVDQVWFSNVLPGQVTVHWVNKGDAQGYHIAYGLEPNKWLWGVEVGNVDQYTLSNLPTGVDIWVTVIPLGGDKCPGAQSEPTKVGGVQVLAATGTSISTLLFLAGFGFLALGLWQLNSALVKRERRQAR